MLRALLLCLSERKTPQRFLTNLPAVRKLHERFVAGESIAEALAAVGHLRGDGFEFTLDHLGESVHDPATAAAATQAYLQILDRLKDACLRPNISIKLTSLGLAFDEALARRNLAALADRACQHQGFVRIDMEGSPYTESTLRVFRALDAPRDRVGVVIQAYLHRSEKDVQNLTAVGAWVRLTKGAYQEPASIAFPKKAQVDANYVKLMTMLLASSGYHAIATHDPRMIAATQEYAREKGIGPDRFEFQMLYGVRRRLQRELLKQGYRVRIYVPYGRQWYPYFMRRLAERPANVLFLLRNLARG
ncbi:MAG TPA: proline dehydrogenase family protein [Terriglobia bacterium]|nr:proline dehydrogenase family protein [Terriglobia bacterium]